MCIKIISQKGEVYLYIKPQLISILSFKTEIKCDCNVPVTNIQAVW